MLFSVTDEAPHGGDGKGEGEADDDNDEDDMDHHADGSGIRGSADGDGGGGGGGRRGGRGKADTRRGIDVPPSGTEIRAFFNLFEDIAVNPPQDAVLRQHWDTWVKEDVGKHNTQQNRQVGRGSQAGWGVRLWLVLAHGCVFERLVAVVLLLSVMAVDADYSINRDHISIGVRGCLPCLLYIS